MNKNVSWIYKVFLLTFFLALIFSSISSGISDKFNIITLSIILIIIISLGIVFDMIGVAVLSCSEAPFHAKASKRIKGAKESIKLIKNAPQVSSICNDIIGDVCGIISGSIGVVLAIKLSTKLNGSEAIITILLSAIISSLTVGFKAVCKRIATEKSESIIFIVGKILHFFKINLK